MATLMDCEQDYSCPDLLSLVSRLPLLSIQTRESSVAGCSLGTGGTHCTTRALQEETGNVNQGLAIVDGSLTLVWS